MNEQKEKSYIDTIDSIQADNYFKESRIAELEATVEAYQLQNQIKYEQGTKKASRKGRSKHFTKVLTKSTQVLIRKKIITLSEAGVLFYLLPYVEFETNFVVDDRKGRMNIRDISELVDMSYSQTKSILDNLEQLGIINKVKNGVSTHIQLNSIYIYKG
jgi:DNA-binding MarR family transcriptional regulator